MSGMTPDQQTVWDLKIREGLTVGKIATRLGMSNRQARRRWEEARDWHRADPAISNMAIAVGANSPAAISHGWTIVKDDEGNGHSVFIKNTEGEQVALTSIIEQTLDDLRSDMPTTFPKRPPISGDHLLVIDIADLHVGKLCVKTETGHTYSRETARHRAIEGTKALLQMASGAGVSDILFVMGNDIVHTDNAKGTTTSGTPQDTDGTIHQMISDAQAILVECIDLCADAAQVHLAFCPSNHDWVTGYCIARTVQAWFRNDPRVTASDYNMSERHRKYVLFGSNLIGLSHGDGAKESELYPLMVTEAREHISQAKHLYFYLHHYHHKIRNRVTRIKERGEKDLTGMTVIGSGVHNEGEGLEIEYLRSPSAPDGWHHRNGYLNRQAVECFVHHPEDGQKMRFTEWF